MATTISSSVLSQAQTLNANGQVAAAWQLLANAGDIYASAAYQVVSNPTSFYGLIARSTWVAAGANLNLFNKVAQDYQANYLNDINSNGLQLPTTTNIETDYLNALEADGQPPYAAIDADIEVGAPFFFPNWYRFTGVESSRIGPPSSSLSNLNAATAQQIFWSSDANTTTTAFSLLNQGIVNPVTQMGVFFGVNDVEAYTTNGITQFYDVTTGNSASFDSNYNGTAIINGQTVQINSSNWRLNNGQYQYLNPNGTWQTADEGGTALIVAESDTSVSDIPGGSTVIVNGPNAEVSSDSGSIQVVLTDNNDTVNVSGGTVTIAANLYANLNGNYNDVTLDSTDSVGVYGGGNTITATQNDFVVVGNTNGALDSVTANNDQAGGYNPSAPGTGIAINPDAGANVDGNNNAVYLEANTSYAGLSGSSNDAVYAASGGTVAPVSNISFNVLGQDAQVFANSGDSFGVYEGGGNYITNVGPNDLVVVGGTNGTADTIAATNDPSNGTTASGQTAGIIVTTDSQAYVDGSNNAVAVAGGSTATIDDSGDDVSAAGGSTLVTTGNTGFNVIGFSFSGGYGYYGIAASKPGGVAPGIDVVAQYDANGGYQQAATSAQAALTQAEQAAAGDFATSSATLSKQPSGAFWTDPTITWSFAAGADTGAAPFSGAIGAQEQPIIEDAIETWEAASALTFQQVGSDVGADITIGWGDFDTGNSGVVAYTTANRDGTWLLPGTVVRLEDPSETALTEDANGQLVYGETDVTLYQSALHEIGRALGLADTSDPNSVMYATLGPNNTTLDSTDIAAIQALYGPEGTAAAFFPQQSTLTAAQATQSALAATESQTALFSTSAFQ